MAEKTVKLQELRENLAKFAEGKDFSEFTPEDKTTWASMNEEAKTLADEIRQQQIFEKDMKANEEAMEAGKTVASLPIHEEQKEMPKALGEQVRESRAYKSYMEDGQLNISSEVKYNPLLESKTLVDEGSAYPPAVTRSNLIVPTALRNPNSVIDLFSVIPTDTYQYKYLEETTFTGIDTPNFLMFSVLSVNAKALSPNAEPSDASAALLVNVVSSKYLY